MHRNSNDIMFQNNSAQTNKLTHNGVTEGCHYVKGKGGGGGVGGVWTKSRRPRLNDHKKIYSSFPGLLLAESNRFAVYCVLNSVQT